MTKPVFINIVDQNVVVTKLIPPYEKPDVPCAVYSTYDVEIAVHQFQNHHGIRPKVVYQDYTDQMIYIPLEQK